MQLREKKTWLDRSLLVSLKKKRNDMGWRGTDAWLPMSHSKVYNSEPVRRILLDHDCGVVCRWTIVAMTVTYTTWLSIRIVWSPSQHIPGHWLWHFVIFLQRYVPQSKRLHFKVHPTKSAHNHIVWLINTISVNRQLWYWWTSLYEIYRHMHRVARTRFDMVSKHTLASDNSCSW